MGTRSDIWDETSAPSSTPVEVDGGQALIETNTTYDGAGRPVTVTTKTHSVTRWSTTSTYTGDTVATSAPKGGQAVAVVTNALGQTIERRE